MGGIENKKRLAADILKCGVSRVRVDPERIGMVEAAVTRDDIRRLIKQGVIYKIPKRSPSRGRHVERRQGPGSRKGGKKARQPRKELYVRRIRALRRFLRELKRTRRITVKTYRMLYRRLSMFRSKRHLREYIEKEGLYRKAVYEAGRSA